MFQDRDDAWVDVDNVINSTFIWLDQRHTRLLYVSERDGWRHAYAVSRDGDARLITTGAFDLVSISAVDEAGGWLVLHRLAGQRHAALSLPLAAGWQRQARARHTGRPARHAHLQYFAGRRIGRSTLIPDSTTRAISDLISLPDHKVVRVFQDNAALEGTRSPPILAGRTEMFQVDSGRRREAGRLAHQAIQFRRLEKISAHRQRVWRTGRHHGQRQLGRRRAGCCSRRWPMTVISWPASTIAARPRPKAARGARSFTAPWACWPRRSRPPRCARWRLRIRTWIWSAWACSAGAAAVP